MKINAETFEMLFSGINLPYVPQTWEERGWFLLALFAYREARGLVSTEERELLEGLMSLAVLERGGESRLRGATAVRAVWRLYDPAMLGEMWGEARWCTRDYYPESESPAWCRSPVHRVAYAVRDGAWVDRSEYADFELPDGASWEEFHLYEDWDRGYPPPL